MEPLPPFTSHSHSVKMKASHYVQCEEAAYVLISCNHPRLTWFFFCPSTFKFCYFQIQHPWIVAVKPCLSRKPILGRSEKRASNRGRGWLWLFKDWADYLITPVSGPLACGTRTLLGHSQFWDTGWAPCSTPSAAAFILNPENSFHLLRYCTGRECF